MINDGRGTDPVHRSSTAKTKEPQEATRTDVERTKSAAFAYFCAKSMREAVERFSIYCFRLISAQFCTELVKEFPRAHDAASVLACIIKLSAA